MDAAASRFRLLFSDAAAQAAQEACEAASAKPADAHLKRTAELANAHGFIVGQRVEPSNEIAGLGPAIDQHRAVFGCPPPTLLLDGGFASNTLWSTLGEQGIDALCPSGRTDSDGDWVKRSSRPGKFTKREFHYDSARDVYRCPAGRELSFAYQEHDAFGPAYREYWGGRQCARVSAEQALHRGGAGP